MAEAKLFACAERAHLLPVFGRQLKKLASLGESASLFLHCVFDELCGRSLGYAQFGAAHELNPVVSSWRDFLALAVGLNLTSEQVRSARKHQILRFVHDLEVFFPRIFSSCTRIPQHARFSVPAFLSCFVAASHSDHGRSHDLWPDRVIYRDCSASNRRASQRSAIRTVSRRLCIGDQLAQGL